MNNLEPKPKGTSGRALLLAELLFTLIVIALLGWVATPLADDTALAGLDARYDIDLDGNKAEKATQMQWLLQNLSTVIANLGLGGWLALRAGRSQLPRPAALLCMTAVWCGVWAITFGRADNTAWLIASGSFAVIALLAVKNLPLAADVAPVKPILPTHAFAYPGWVLFTGIGLIWLADYSAFAHPKLRFLAASHVEALFVSYLVVTLVAAYSASIAGLLSRIFAAVDKATDHTHATGVIGIRRLRPLAIPLGFTLWALVIVLAFGDKRPALTSELLRLPFYLVFGWVLYRWALHGRAARSSRLAAMCFIALAMGLIGTADYGQLLLIGLGLATATGAATARILGGSRAATLAGVLAALLVVWAGLGLINNYGHLVSKHIGQRSEAIAAPPFQGKLEYLSELRWLAASTPTFGHGLTKVPYCGTIGAIEVGAKCRAAPMEMHSDYVFAGLSAAWGMWVAFVISAALAFWLVSLVQVKKIAHAGDPNDFRQWVVTCFVVVTLVQLLFTCLGNVGLVPLTGVTFPLLAHGSASLITSSALLGFAMHR
jgi:cell division protein FtsW (lipid II flippase)